MRRACRCGPGAILLGMIATATIAAAVAAATAAAPAAGAPANALEGYLSGLDSLSVQFTQTVTDRHGTQGEAGSGRLLVQRPGRFRWDYQPVVPGPAARDATGAAARGQLLVADGHDLWYYDRELAQVTVRPVSAAVSSTPIVLLSGSNAQLEQSFQFAAGEAHDGLQWVEVRPRGEQADFSRAELGFAGERLVRMIVHDRLGQTVALTFSDARRNARIDPAEFRFRPPPGVDVIGAPQGEAPAARP